MLVAVEVDAVVVDAGHDALFELAYHRRELFEYWGHAASYMPVTLQPLLRWRMAQAGSHAWGGMRRIESEKPGYVAGVLAEVAAHGPLAASELM